MKKLNKKGFTLVELLAVIVVLAIIMVLTVPSVLSSMNSARQSSFLLYAGKMIEAAQSKYQSESLLTTPSTCYDLTTLSGNGSTQYKGIITVEMVDGNPVFKIRMYDNNYQIGFKAKTTDPEKGEVALSDKAGGVTYADIETIKSDLAKKATLQAAPDDNDKKSVTGDKKNYPTSCSDKY